ncbi:hypothetical protein BJY01DRAFT_196939 [Aspergillus pseudoustus]|uniref:Uncharacterized protein n=1 Tax=Aspergillus pseudoustus TaxID=1810923 RepID=A0ABR4JWK6_9EURO
MASPAGVGSYSNPLKKFKYAQSMRLFHENNTNMITGWSFSASKAVRAHSGRPDNMSHLVLTLNMQSEKRP